MSTCKISYNGNEISAVDEAAPVSVAYNNATIATLNDGDTKTLGCHGKVMASNVVIGSKTLNCNGKLMQGDIVVELVGSAASGETWYFNDTLPEGSKLLMFNFNANDKQFVGIRLVYSDKWGLVTHDLQYLRDVASYVAYHNGDWTEELRTIVLDEPATGDVLAFLEANATKLS